jgi:hypothetical protein
LSVPFVGGHGYDVPLYRLDLTVDMSIAASARLGCGSVIAGWTSPEQIR